MRKTDIAREVESLDGKKYDYLISYGLFGPIVVELKLMNNKEIQRPSERKSYKEKLKKYLRANNGLGVYAVFDVKNNASELKHYKKMLTEYNDIDGLTVLSLNCIS